MSTPASREQQLVLSCRLASVPVGRHFVRDTLLGWGLARLVADAELGVSELIANAVRYARTEVTLTVSAGEQVTIAVLDGEPRLSRPVPPIGEDMLAESGRGLRIVAAVADDWGVEARAGGKSVWFSLALPDGGTVDAELHQLQRARPTARPGLDDRAAVLG